MTSSHSELVNIIPLTKAIEFDGKSVMAIVFFSTAGGLFTGADEVKSAEHRTRFGGLANAILDPCYHSVRNLTAL